jgi:hypothetical protein
MSVLKMASAVKTATKALNDMGKSIDTFTKYKLEYEKFLKKLAERTTGFYTGATLLNELAEYVRAQAALGTSAIDGQKFYEYNVEITKVVNAINTWLIGQGFPPFDLDKFKRYITPGKYKAQSAAQGSQAAGGSTSGGMSFGDFDSLRSTGGLP